MIAMYWLASSKFCNTLKICPDEVRYSSTQNKPGLWEHVLEPSAYQGLAEAEIAVAKKSGRSCVEILVWGTTTGRRMPFCPGLIPYLPLQDEVTIICHNWSDFVIMIDDFRVSDDLGYAHDDYGKGNVLCLEYLALEDLQPVDIYWPSMLCCSKKKILESLDACGIPVYQVFVFSYVF